MSTQDTSHNATNPDPTPRTAATARERVDVDAVIRNWWNDGPRKTWRKDFADPDTRRDWLEELGRQMTRALAAAEAPGRVAALEAALRRIVTHAQDRGEFPGDWYEVSGGAIDAARTLLAAPASPAGVSGEGLPDASYLFRPAPTPSEPVARSDAWMTEKCSNCPHVKGRHLPDWGCMVPDASGPCGCTLSFTPATRDE